MRDIQSNGMMLLDSRSIYSERQLLIWVKLVKNNIHYKQSKHGDIVESLTLSNLLNPLDIVMRWGWRRLDPLARHDLGTSFPREIFVDGAYRRGHRKSSFPEGE
jgi:hypothetical protein